MLLETYSALPTDQLTMPDFLTIKREVTGEPRFDSYFTKIFQNCFV